MHHVISEKCGSMHMFMITKFAVNKCVDCTVGVNKVFTHRLCLMIVQLQSQEGETENKALRRFQTLQIEMDYVLLLIHV